MKDKTQKSFRGIARTLLLVFCYAFGSHTFALALEHEQTVETYKVTDVPNPRNESSSNWVSNPNQILDESYVWGINNMLSQLEDSLSIEVTVVALPSIGEDIPAEFAHKLFEHWGIGKKADDNGLLILLVLDQRKVTFATGYGLEGVLPDALCFRIQQNEMVPWFRKNDFDRGITEGVRAVTLVLYGSDYEPVSQGTSDNYWKSASNTLWNFLANQPPMLWVFLILVNVITYLMKVNKARPKDSSALAAIKVLTLYNPLGCLVLFFLVWPALIAASLWHKFYQKQRVILQSKTCDSCKAVALQLLPNELATPLLSASEQMEHKLGSAIHRIYQCTSCGWLLRYKSITISEYRMCNQCHTIASKRISPWKTIKEPTYSDAGLEVADYLCLMCGDKKQTTQKIPRKTPPNSDSSSNSHSSSGRSSSRSSSGSFGGGHSGGGGASSSF